jgi:gliding motility-associated protein GldC
MAETIAKQSDIKFTVALDEKQIPVSIDWTADDSGMEGAKPCKAVLISLWDGNEQTSMRIDLWTKDMSVEEMRRFFYETFMGMAETYQRATDEKDVAKEIRAFGDKFSLLTGVK